MDIQMVDLKKQYGAIKPEIDRAIAEVLDTTAFIQGPSVKKFEEELAAYHNVKHVIACANGTDALQIIMMALGYKPGDEVLIPAFTYVATAEVIALLGLVPVMVDVRKDTFAIDTEAMEKAITPKTKGIVPVHLFGQCADMESILRIASKHNLHVIEDGAQSIGAVYTFKNGVKKMSGTMGTAGSTSFFPSKNLGCYGDGGAIFTQDDDLAKKIRMIANHGQSVKYYHDIVGVNSRLDTLQAAILSVKLRKLDTYRNNRQQAAAFYDKKFEGHKAVTLPYKDPASTHVYHQYTLQVKEGERDGLKKHLADKGIPSMVYYPVPLHLQKAYTQAGRGEGAFPVTESLCPNVISLPMHTELDSQQLEFISSAVLSYFE